MEQPPTELQQALAAAAAAPGSAARAVALAALLLERAAELAASAPARLQLQADLCASLLQSLADVPEAAAGGLLERVWADACPAFAHMCRSWEDEEVVLGTISFIRAVSAMLLGNAPPPPQQQQEQQQQRSQQAFVAWLLALGEGCVAAVLQLLEGFQRLTHISHVAHEPRSAAAHVLLVFLQTGSSPAVQAAAAQLLQLARWPATPQPCAGAGQQQHRSSAATTAAAALTAGEAFAACCQLLQCAAEALPRGEWQRMAATAGAWLRDAYGWADSGPADGGAAGGAPAAVLSGNSSTIWPPHLHHHQQQQLQQQRRRPDESLYDAFMLELLLHMLQGPAGDDSAAGGVAGGSSSKQQATDMQEAAASQQQEQQQARARQHAQCWHAWADSDGCGALSVLLATYDRPGRLVRGLVSAQGDDRAAAAAADAGARAAPAPAKKSGSSGSKVAKASMHKALELLHRVFMWHTHWPASPAADSQAAPAAAAHDAAARVQRLLAGLAELLRPQANCAVEWRVAGLQAMQEAVEQFSAEHPGDEALSCQLWCSESVDSLLCCLRCDASSKVRRAAVAVLQLVVLPQGCHLAGALLRALAQKVADKDACVAASALELLVQLPLGLLCGCVPGGQFCAAVQAGAQLCCGDGGVPAATREQFLDLLRDLLLYEGPGDATEQRRAAWLAAELAAPHTARAWLCASAATPVGLAGCRMLLLMMLQDPQLQGQWQRLQQQVAVVGAGGGGAAT